MEYHIPDYYRTFSCIGSACPDTCCGGWQIPIDRRSLARYPRPHRRRRGKGIWTPSEAQRGLSPPYLPPDPAPVPPADAGRPLQPLYPCRPPARCAAPAASIPGIRRSSAPSGKSACPCPVRSRPHSADWPRRPRIHTVQSRRSCPPGQAVDPVLLDRLFRLRETMLNGSGLPGKRRQKTPAAWSPPSVKSWIWLPDFRRLWKTGAPPGLLSRQVLFRRFPLRRQAAGPAPPCTAACCRSFPIWSRWKRCGRS